MATSKEIRDATIQAITGCIKEIGEHNKQIAAWVKEDQRVRNFNDGQDEKQGAAKVVWEGRKKKYEDDVDDWKNKRGKYSKYIEFGTDQPFRIRWGWDGWDTNNACRECARGEKGWGEGSKFGNGAWCEGKSGRLAAADSYRDTGEWESHGNFRKSWTCKKSQTQKDTEILEYNNAKPSAFTEPEPKKGEGLYYYQRKPSDLPTLNANCCTNVVNVAGEASNIKQTCEQAIQKKDSKELSKTLGELSGTTPSPSAPSSSSTTKSTDEKEEETAGTENNTQLIDKFNQLPSNTKTIIIVIIIIIIILILALII